MSSLNYLTSGLVQINNPGTSINGITNFLQNTNTSSNTTTTTQADCNIYPVGNTLTPNDVIYHDQTILMVNSTINQNSNTVQAQYFDPVCGTPCPALSNWNYDLTGCSYLNGTMATSSMISDELSLFSNLQPNAALNGTGKHTIDITNYSNNIPAPVPANTLFFSLTAQPYYTQSGSATGSVCSPFSAPTSTNVDPGYTSGYNSYNFLFVSNYYVQQKNEIIIVELLFTVSNTNATTYAAGSTQGVPSLSVIIKNKILTNSALASLSTDSSDISKVKVYTAGPIPLQYSQAGSWDSKNFYYSTQNNVPLIIAPGYTKLYATLPVAYIPASSGGKGWSMKQSCYTISGAPVTPTFGINNGFPESGQPGYAAGPPPTMTYFDYESTPPTTTINYGHFVVGVAFSVDYNNYKNYSNISAEVLIKNIWKSPIAIYNSYKNYTVNDMATKQVVLLFGRNLTGGTFLVLNTGTPVVNVTNYAVTSLRNFITIMRAIINLFDGSVSIVDYFINATTVAQVNASGSYDASVIVPQPLMDGAIQNPPTINNCPGMWYLMLNSKNSFNMAIDPSEQNVFGQQIGINYLGIPNSLLCSIGNCVYMQSSLNITTDDEGNLFGNSLSLGLNLINTQTYYILIILPEALFNPNINTALPNNITIYSTPNTAFYIMVTPNSGSQFSPASGNMIATSSAKTTNTQNGSSTSNNLTLQPTYSIQKVLLSVSNSKLF